MDNYGLSYLYLHIQRLEAEASFILVEKEVESSIQWTSSSCDDILHLVTRSCTQRKDQCLGVAQILNGLGLRLMP